MDAWYPKAADAVLAPVLGELTPRFAQLRGRGGAASSFGSGWYSYIDKDLRTLLGRNVKGKFANRYCGSGRLQRVRRVAVGVARRRGRRARGRAGRRPGRLAQRRERASGSSSCPA